MPDGDVISLSPDEVQKAHCTDHKTGKKIERELGVTCCQFKPIDDENEL